MAIVTISRGCFSHGSEIAQQVAQKLGYECVSREVLIEASKFFKVPEMRLVKSMQDAPSILERFTHGRETYLAYVRAALLEYAKQDKLVYHGLGGRLLLTDVPCLLSVRIIADMDQRIAYLQSKQEMTRDQAFKHLRAEDRMRYDWSRYLYNQDINDPALYDLVIHIGGLKIADASDIICAAAQSAAYRPTEKCRQTLCDIAISSNVRALLQEMCDAEVTSKNGFVHVKVAAKKIRKADYAAAKTEAAMRQSMHDEMSREIVAIAHTVPGVKEVVCDIEMPYYA